MSHSFDQPEQLSVLDEPERAERVFLAHNMVQIYYAKLVYRNEHAGAEAPEQDLMRLMSERSGDFRAWYTSKEGEEALDNYVRQHDNNSIEEMKDMGDLAQSFLRFMNHPKQETKV